MSLVGNPRRNARKRNPPAACRRALELLAGTRDGCTEAIMLAHGPKKAQKIKDNLRHRQTVAGPRFYERIGTVSAPAPA
jgi:hypothetical protein